MARDIEKMGKLHCGNPAAVLLCMFLFECEARRYPNVGLWVLKVVVVGRDRLQDNGRTKLALHHIQIFIRPQI